mgnify:CR=1 FL=1
MKEIVVISGKGGGTRKSSLLAAFASLARNKVLCDADADAAHLRLIMAPEVKERQVLNRDIRQLLARTNAPSKEI